MGIRTGKVMTELNIGLETVVEYLESVPGLKPEKELNPNTKLSDAQYEALKKRFQKDKIIKEQADSIFSNLKKHNSPYTQQSDNKKMEVKVVGKIDLSSINQSTRPPRKTKEERRAERESKAAKLKEKSGDVKKRKRIRKTSIEPTNQPQKDDINHVFSHSTDEQNLPLKKTELVGRSTPIEHQEKNNIVKEYVPFSQLSFEDFEVILKFKKKIYIHNDYKIRNYKQVISKYIKTLTYNEWKKFKSFHVMVSIDKNKGKFDFVDFNLHDYLRGMQEKMQASKKRNSKENVSGHLIRFTSLRFSKGEATYKYYGIVYRFKNPYIKDFNAIINQYTKQCSSLERSLLDEFTIKVKLDKATKTFSFLDFNLLDYVDSLYQKTIFLKSKARVSGTSIKNEITTNETSLIIDNIEFQDGYYWIWILKDGNKDLSIAPLKVNDTNSYSCLRFVHKYFSERFPAGVRITYNEKSVISISQPYMLSRYVRVLHDNMNIRGEWWEEVQNARKRSFAQCFGESRDYVKSKYLKSKNEYLYNLSSLQNEKKLIRVYEINHGKEEDAFIFTIDMSGNRNAIIFENASNDASTTTWVFVAKNENYEACINLIFDYFTDYTISAKRSSLRAKTINPPEKFMADSYAFIDHDDLEQWLKKLNRILENEPQPSEIKFVPGLNIPQSPETRTPSGNTITTSNLHNQLMLKLYNKLCGESGKDYVGTEIRVGTKRIDAVVKGKGFYDIYEVKTASNSFDCVTEALGQICQYAYLYCRDNIGKMVIVGAPAASSEVEQYLSWFRKKHSMEVYYMQVPLE